MREPYVLENLLREKLCLGLLNIKILILNMQVYHSVIKTENGKFMISNQSITFQEADRSLIMRHLSFLTKPGQEEPT